MSERVNALVDRSAAEVAELLRSSRNQYWMIGVKKFLDLKVLLGWSRRLGEHRNRACRGVWVV